MNEDAQNYFVVDALWSEKYLHAKAGFLVMENIDTYDDGSPLDQPRVALQEELQKTFAGFSREQFNELPVIAAYNRYYKNFGKTYHVRSQVESIAGGKPLKSPLPVLTAMFMAEVKNMLLTAGHDLDVLQLPVRLTIGTDGTMFTDIRGAEKNMEVGDMMMTDNEGIISSIILGPDGRTKITSDTKNVLFTVYAPSEITKEIVTSHLQDIEHYVKLFSPESVTKLLAVVEA